MNNFINTLRQHTAYGDNKQPQPWLNWVVEMRAWREESGTAIAFWLRDDRGFMEAVKVVQTMASKPAAIIAKLPPELVEALSAYELESGCQRMNSLEEALQHQLA